MAWQHSRITSISRPNGDLRVVVEFRQDVTNVVLERVFSTSTAQQASWLKGLITAEIARLNALDSLEERIVVGKPLP